VVSKLLIGLVIKTTLTYVYKPSPYLLVTYFPTYLCTYHTYFLRNPWFQDETKVLTQLRFIHNWVIMDFQWMLYWWVVVRYGHVPEWKPAPTNASLVLSIGWVAFFHPTLYHSLPLLAAHLWLFFFCRFLLDPNLHTTIPPSYTANLPTSIFFILFKI